MKKVVSILLAVIFILSLSGCKNNEENTEDTSTSESTTEPTTEEIDYDNLVTDAYSGTKNNRKISIPKINLDSKEIDELNDEIWQDLYVNGVEGRDDISSTNSGDYISYRWYVNDDIISVIITDGTEHEIWYSYIVYNISIENKNIVDNETVITSAGFTMDEYYDKAKDAIGSEFISKYGQFKEEFSEYEDTAEDYNEALDNSLSKENINSAFPYLNKNGELCIIAPIYSISQMDITFHETDLNLESFELVEGYDEKAVFAEESVQTEPETTYSESEKESENSQLSDGYDRYIEIVNNLLDETEYYSKYENMKWSFVGALDDIDNDGIDEMLLRYTKGDNNILGQIWTIKDGKAVCILDDVLLSVMAGQPDDYFYIGTNGGKEYLCLYRQFGETFTDKERYQVFEETGSGYVLKYTLDKVSEHMGSDGKYVDEPVSVQYQLDGTVISESEFLNYEVKENERVFSGAGVQIQIEDFLEELQS